MKKVFININYYKLLLNLNLINGEFIFLFLKMFKKKDQDLSILINILINMINVQELRFHLIRVKL